MEQRADLLNLLNYIPPSELDYQESDSSTTGMWQ